jgi:hypothetical protein
LLTSSGKKRGGERERREYRDQRRKRSNIVEEEKGERQREIFFDTGYMCGVYHRKLDKKRERIKRECNKKRCLAHQPRTEIEYT